LNFKIVDDRIIKSFEQDKHMIFDQIEAIEIVMEKWAGNGCSNQNMALDLASV
jgi:hypothetical protein